MFNSSITASATELIVFRQKHPAAIRVTGNLLRDGGNGYDPAAIRSLPLGSYLANNRLTGGSVAGKLF